MKKSYYYCEKFRVDLEQYLCAHKVKYEVTGDGSIVPKIVSFYVSDREYNDLSFQSLIHGKPIISNRFDRREILEAKYLTMRPIKNVVDIANPKQAYTYKCQYRTLFGDIRYRHQDQTNIFQIEKMKSFGSTSFFSPSTGFSAVFGTIEACHFISSKEFTGLIYVPVKDNRTGYDSDLIQLIAEKTIPFEKLYINKDQKVKYCPNCGEAKVIVENDFQLVLRAAADELSKDFYMTERIFGDGFSVPLFLVSQKMYRAIEDAKLNRNVRFEPVMFLE